MSNDETLNLHIDADYRGDGAFSRLKRDIRDAKREMSDLGRQSVRTDRDFDPMEGRLDRVNKKMDQFNRHGTVAGRMTGILSRAFRFAAGSIGLLQGALMPAAASLAGFVSILGAARLALASADVATKIWQASLTGLVGGLAIAVAGVAAYQAALSDIKATALQPFTSFNGGTDAVMKLWEGLLGDTRLAPLGAQNLQDVSGRLIEAGIPLGEISKYLNEFGDLAFYAGRGDPGSAIGGIMEAVIGLGDGTQHLSTEQLETFAQAFGPAAEQIEAAGEAFVGQHTQEFIDFLMSDPSSLSGLNYGLDEMSTTLVGVVKSFGAVTKGAMQPFGTIIERTAVGPLTKFRDAWVGFIERVMPSITIFALDALPKLLDALQRLMGWVEDKFITLLPQLSGEMATWGEETDSFFDKVKRGWDRVKPVLEQLARAWDVVWSALRPIAVGLGGMLGRFIMGGATGLTDNAGKMQSLGESIGKIFREGGPVENFLRNTVEAVSILVETLGAPVVDALINMKGPGSLWELIIRNKDVFQQVGENLVRIVDEGLKPILDIFWRIMDKVVKLLPDVTSFFGDLAGAAATIMGALEPVLNVLIGIVDQLGLAGPLLAGILGVTALSKMGLLAGPGGLLGKAGRAAGVLGPIAGLLGVGAGMDMAGGGNPWGIGLSGLSGAGLAGMLGLGPWGMAGAGVLTAGASAYQFLTRSDEVPISEGTISAVSTINDAISGLDFLDWRGVDKVTDSLSALQEFGDLRFDGNIFETYPENSQEFFDYVQSVKDNLGNLGIDESFFQHLWDGGQDAEFFLEELNNQGDELERKYGIYRRNMNNLREGLGEFSEQEIAAMAEQVGVDLTAGALSLSGGIKMIDAVAGQMLTIGQLWSQELNRLIYAPQEQAQYETDFTTGTEDIINAINEGTYDPAMLEDFMTPIVQRYEGMVNTGAMSFEEGSAAAIADLTRIKDSMTGVSDDAVADVQAMIDKVKEASEAARAADEAQRLRLNKIVIDLSLLFKWEMEDVIDGLGARARAIMGLPGPPGPTSYNPLTGGSVPLRTTTQVRPRATDARYGDTASSRLAALWNTSKVHKLIAGATPGNLNVTSMMRDHHLGSSNSDHLTGRALDVTGSHLGLYAMKMRELGGFAEFHGTGQGRHLHVVPPTNVAYGDRPLPRPPSPATPRQTHEGSSKMFTTNVYPSRTMDEEMLARRVVRTLRRQETNNRERR